MKTMQRISNEWSPSRSTPKPCSEPLPSIPVGSQGSGLKEACIFSFDHPSPMSVATKTSSVQSQPVFRQNSAFISNQSQFTPTTSYPSSPWMNSPPQTLSPNVFQSRQPLSGGACQAMLSPPSPVGMFGDQLYQIQRVQLSNMHLGRYPVAHQTRPPLWNSSPAMFNGDVKLHTDHAAPTPMLMFGQLESQAPSLHSVQQSFYQEPPKRMYGSSEQPPWTPTTAEHANSITRHIPVEHAVNNMRPIAVGTTGNILRPIPMGTASDTVRPIPVGTTGNILRPIPMGTTSNAVRPMPVGTTGNIVRSIPVGSPTRIVRPIPVYANRVHSLDLCKPLGSTTEKLKEPTSPTLPSWPQEKPSSSDKSSFVDREPHKQSKKRSVIDADTSASLEEEFQQNRSPSQAEVSKISAKYILTKGAVRTWFSARRQKQKRMERELANHQSDNERIKVPSENYDITVEVPSINPRDRGSVVHQDYKN